MYRNIIIVVSMLLLLMLAGGVTSAQSQQLSKRITSFNIESWQTYISYSSTADSSDYNYGDPITVTLRRYCFSWAAPSDAPDSYRVSWKPQGMHWRSMEKPNVKKGGNAIVTDNRVCIGTKNNVYRTTGKDNGGLRFPIPENSDTEGMLIRVRARYDDQRNGPWACCARVVADVYRPHYNRSTLLNVRTVYTGGMANG